MKIYLGKLKDINDVTKIIKEMSYALKFINNDNEKFYSEDRIKEFLFDYIIDNDCGFFICKNEKEEIMGILLCYLYQPLVTDNRYKRAQDVFIQPHPNLSKKMKGRVFIKLLKTYEHWAIEKKAKEIFLGVNIRFDITKYLFRHGYKIADVLLKKEA